VLVEPLSKRALDGPTDVDNRVMIGEEIHATLSAEIDALGGDLLTAINARLATPHDMLALPMNAESTNNVSGCLGL